MEVVLSTPKRLLAGPALAGALALLTSQAQAVAVDLELALMVDVSGSIDAADFTTQSGGIEAAFRDSGLIGAIEAGDIGSIAATLIYWSGTGAQSQSVGWTVISDSTSSNAFADAVAAATRPYSGQTAMSEALDFTVPLFTNAFEGTRNVINVSGDGAESVACAYHEAACAPLQASRDAALAAGIDTINALLIKDRSFFGNSGGETINSVDYANTNLIGGANAFVLDIDNFGEYAGAMLEKIRLEVLNSSPYLEGSQDNLVIREPAGAALFGLGLLGLGVARRRKSGVN
jgi:hypothetical protein